MFRVYLDVWLFVVFLVISFAVGFMIAKVRRPHD